MRISYLIFLLITQQLALPVCAEPQKLGIEEAETLIPKAEPNRQINIYDIFDDKFSTDSFPKNGIYDRLYPTNTVLASIFYEYIEQIDNIDIDGGASMIFAVNWFTGDVWDWIECKRLSSPDLTKAQRDIRSHVSPADMRQFQQLSDVEPECF